MNQPCMDQNQPCMYLKSSKKQAQAASIWLDKKSFPKQKKWRDSTKKNHFRLQRNGTFFLLLRRFFKLPDLEFPLHGCNLTNFFWNKTLNKKQKQNLQPRKKSRASRGELSNGKKVFLLGFALKRAFEEALHALKHIKSFQENQLWTKEQCESFSKLELQIQNFQVGRMNCYKPTVLSVPTTWAFRWALDSRIPTSSVWRRQFEYRRKKFFQFNYTPRIYTWRSWK